jgi:glycosyltransferase involved in cell wall biosynthesis
LDFLISIIVPCRNERQHIDAFCDSVLQQKLPVDWQMEVIVADGDSDDGTRQQLEQRCSSDARLILVDNPGRIVSTGLNACIARARGSIIARLDVHSQFASDYLAQCIAALARTGADNVGGPWVAQGTGPTGAAIAAAFQCRWVVGGARSRATELEGEVDTVYLGCWPRSVFDRFGNFDETLVRNQDDEHNLRLRLGGARIWQSRLIRSTYQPRNSLRQLFAQQRQYGYWRPFVMRKHGQAGAARQLVPAAFVAATVASVVLLPWSALPIEGLALAYTSYLLVASTAAARSAGHWALLLRLPATIAAFHLGYGLGTWRGLWDIARSRRPSQAFAKITR